MPENHNLHPNYGTDYSAEEDPCSNAEEEGGLELSVQTGMLPMAVSLSVLLEVKSCTRKILPILLANRRVQV